MHRHESIHQQIFHSAQREKIQINIIKEWWGWGGRATGLNIRNWNWSTFHLTVLTFNPSEQQKGDGFWWSHRKKRSKCRELNTATFLKNKTHLKMPEFNHGWNSDLKCNNKHTDKTTSSTNVQRNVWKYLTKLEFPVKWIFTSLIFLVPLQQNNSDKISDVSAWCLAVLDTASAKGSNQVS